MNAPAASDNTALPFLLRANHRNIIHSPEAQTFSVPYSMAQKWARGAG
jgi:hypothetical protein